MWFLLTLAIAIPLFYVVGLVAGVVLGGAWITLSALLRRLFGLLLSH